VFVPVGKPLHLVLDGWTIARAPPCDCARIDRRFVEVVADHGMYLGRRPGDAAGDLGHVYPVIQEGERDRFRVRRLHLDARPVDTGGAEAGRRPGLEPAHLQTKPVEPVRQSNGRRFADAAGRDALLADMDQAFEKGASRHHDSACPPRPARLADHASGPVVLNNQVLDSVLDQRQVFIFGKDRLDRLAIEFAICLCSRPPHRWPLGPVEHPELDTAAIRRPAHHPVEGVDFTDQMPLAQPANRRVARHLPNGRKLVGHQRRPSAEPRSGSGSLGAGMPTANDNDVECLCGRGHCGGCL